MKRDGEHRASWWKRAAQGTVAAMVATVAIGSAGCLSRPINPLEPTTTTTEVDVLTQSAVDKIDLLLMIDNSASMADKQAILADAVTQLVDGLLNPKCLDMNGMEQPMPAQTSTEACAPGFKREFNAVFDVHIGIVTSSLGGHGSDSCAEGQPGFPNNNDKGQLVSRGLMGASTYKNEGFLQWDPKQKLSPTGIGDLNTLATQLGDMVTGTNQVGCGFEASLEAWYRFLVDPYPYTDIQLAGNVAKQSGKDTTLLAERADFMRSDSLLAIIMLSDENDCSTKEYSYYPLVNQLSSGGGTFYLPAPSKQCQSNPADPCCKSCELVSSSDSCFAGSGCDGNMGPSLGEDTDPANLRCFHNKQRFGIDFLYPTQRYVLALTQARIPDPHANGGADGTNTSGALVENPIFSDLNKSGAAIRDPSLVFIAGIVGVPWQDIAVNALDLKQGFKDYAAMNDPNIKVNGKSVSTWDVILGDPDHYKDPLDPHMVESEKPRSGTDPITGTNLVPPCGGDNTGSPPPCMALGSCGACTNSDPINGHEYNIEPTYGDLEYACIFKLPTDKPGGDDCTGANSPDLTDPLCDPNNTSDQIRAKGYPGIRELSVIKGMSAQGIVGSICPAQLDTPGAADYGYNPAVQGIINRLKLALGGQCLSKTLHPNAQGQVQCLIIEATKSADPSTCNKCASAGHSQVPPENKQAVDIIEQDEKAAGLSNNCFCEIVQAGSDPKDPNAAEELKACLLDPNDPPTDPMDPSGKMVSPVSGWCYVDAQVETIANDIVKNCPDDEKRLVRFVGNGNPQPGGTVYITCTGSE